MATFIQHKPVTVNPLKLSPPLGASLAFMGIRHCMPLMHGSQGCTSFAKVFLVKHFREAIPLQTTAMSEVSTILGGDENIHEAILKIYERSRPEVIGLITTGLTETRGDDIHGALKSFYKTRPEFTPLPVIPVSTPDYQGSLQDGYQKAVEAILHHLVTEERPKISNQITLLAGSHLTPADGTHIKEMAESFGLRVIMLPDLSTSMDGHLEESYSPLTPGGTSLEDIRSIPASSLTLGLGESLREGAEYLNRKFSIPYQVFDQVSGLGVTDKLLSLFSKVSGKPVPAKYRRQRSQLQDAMLDSHFYLGGKKIGIALEPDLLYNVAKFLMEMGVKIPVAVSPTPSPLLDRLPVEKVIIGDLLDFEESGSAADLIITNSHGGRISQRLDIPLYRIGMPVSDRLGAAHHLTVGYEGATRMLFDLGNLLIESWEGRAESPIYHHSKGGFETAPTKEKEK